jgi:hypothetical protein
MSACLEVEDGRMIVITHSKPKFTMNELLAQGGPDDGQDQRE